VAKLGLRYRPSGQADLHAHAEALALLGEDLADVPAPLLDEAARSWTRNERFMPRASELRSLCRKLQAEAIQGTDLGGMQLQDHCDRLNAMKGDKHWFVDGQAPNRFVNNRSRDMAA
jgi:hypothetical protein